MNESHKEPKHIVLERYAVSFIAIICATVLIVIAIIGPLGLGIIEHRTSQSGIYQVAGQDLANLILMTPILFIGAITNLTKKDSAKYFLILTPITLIYTGLSYGIGQEWNNSAYLGNIEHFFMLFLVLIIGGLILGMSSLSMFDKQDAPDFKPRGLRVYVGLMTIFLLFFSMMWTSEVFEVLTTGDTSTGSYQAAPTVFWVIRYLDLGITIPLGFIALYLLITRPKTAYPIILLFFGFFITLGTAVNTMAVVQLLSGDPDLAGTAAGGLVIFPVLAILAYAGFFYLIKHKLKKS
jgi:hypothetical protein